MRRVISLSIAVLALFAATATAGLQDTYPTFFDKFKFEAGGGSQEFSGKIDSGKSNCIKGRKVNVFRKKNGDKDKLGSDKTNGKGKFSVGVGGGKVKNGKYYAEVKESTFQSGSGDQITCLDVKSGSVTIS